MNGRDELLQMMLSRNITPEEFNFDKLTAPPVHYFLSPQDINDLVYLANSVKYSAKIDFKYKEIDRILKARGFELLGRGTNRVVYKYLENRNICLKVAVDHVGSTDNPREFINQEYLKPFVSKIFNVDPSGTIAVAERVHPISSREEFMNYIDGIYDLITKWFIGKYVVNDIGTKFFMNWGIRYSTGIPVLLDYPYFYLLDIRKAKCMTVLEDGTICGGDIDYDDGYNILKCTKCGRHYKAIELAKENVSLNAHSIVTGGKNMRAVITIKKGSNIEKREINPETKKLEEQYSYAAKVSATAVKKVIEEKAEEEKVNRTITKSSESVNILGSQMPKVQAKRNVSIVVNDKKIVTNENDERVTRPSNDKPKKNNNKNKKRTRVAISPSNKHDGENIVIDPRINYVKASVKNATDPVMEEKLKDVKVPEEVKEEPVPVVEEEKKEEVIVEDTIIEENNDEVEVTSAEDETSQTDDAGVHIEDESQEDDADETEVNSDDADAEEITREIVSEEITEEAVVEEDTDEKEPVDVIDEEDEDEAPANITEAIQEAIEESVNDVVEAADIADPDAEEAELMAVEQQIREEREASKKSKKYDPSFYSNKKRPAPKE